MRGHLKKRYFFPIIKGKERIRAQKTGGIFVWNDLNTGAYEGMIAETICIPGHNGDNIRAYYARPRAALHRTATACCAPTSTSGTATVRPWR